MEQLKSLKIVLEESVEAPIDVLAKYIEEHINANWQSVWEDNQDKLQKAYTEAGDMAYGTYLNLLFLPIHKQCKAAGLLAKPNFPGEFDISREWGNEQENDQQRWMWSTVYAPGGEALGTIVSIIFHDHTQFRLPRKPGLLSLRETGKENVVAALSLLSSDFAQALEFTLEYEAYLKSQQSADS